MMGAWIVAPGQCRLPRQRDRAGQLGERQSAKKRPLAAFAAKSHSLVSASRFAAFEGSPQYYVSADDQRFLLLRPVGSGSERLIVVENWFEELKTKSRK